MGRDFFIDLFICFYSITSGFFEDNEYLVG